MKSKRAGAWPPGKAVSMRLILLFAALWGHIYCREALWETKFLITPSNEEEIQNLMQLEAEEHLQVLLDKENKEMELNRRRERNGNFSFGAYHTLEEIYQEMNNLVAEHRGLVSLARIENRPLNVLKLFPAADVPFGCKCAKPESFDELNEVGQKAAKLLASLCCTKHEVGRICSVVYQASGGSIDWSYDFGIKYSFAFELRDTGRYGFLLPATQILPTAEDTWLGLKTIMEHLRDHPY